MIVMATPVPGRSLAMPSRALLAKGLLRARHRRTCRRRARRVVEIVATPPRQALQVLRGDLGEAQVQLFGDRLHARADRDAPGLEDRIRQRLAAEHIAVASVRVIVPTLEDVFIELLGAQPSTRKVAV